MLQYKHVKEALDVMEAIVHRQDITIKVVYLTWPTPNGKHVYRACTGRAQPTRHFRYRQSWSVVRLPYTRALCCALLHPYHCAAYLHSRLLRELRGLDRRHGVHQTLPG
jgi:hypothetical protein